MTPERTENKHLNPPGAPVRPTRVVNRPTWEVARVLFDEFQNLD